MRKSSPQSVVVRCAKFTYFGIMIKERMEIHLIVVVRLISFFEIEAIAVRASENNIVTANLSGVASDFAPDISRRDEIFHATRSPQAPTTILQLPRPGYYRFRTKIKEANDSKLAKDRISNIQRVATLLVNQPDSGHHVTTKYLPPERARDPAVFYTPPGVLCLEKDSELSFLKNSPNTKSLNVAAGNNRHLISEENQSGKENFAATENTKPVYEFDNDRDHEFSKNQRDYVAQAPLQTDRASEPPSASSKAVTRLDHRHHEQSHRQINEKLRHEPPKNSAASFSTLDWFLTDVGYNSQLHPPPNPILSLILSHYGRYLSGNHRPKIYSYMAVNNIHNNKPFDDSLWLHGSEKKWEKTFLHCGYCTGRSMWEKFIFIRKKGISYPEAPKMFTLVLELLEEECYTASLTPPALMLFLHPILSRALTQVFG